MNLFGKKAVMMLGIAAASALVFSASAQQQRPNYEGKPAFAGQTRAPLAKKSARFEITDFVVGLNRPWAMAHMPNGNMLVTEVPGRIRVVSPDGSVSDPVAGVPAVRAWGSRGLNDILLDPDFENNRMIYFTYLGAPEGYETDNSDAAYQKAGKERLEWNGMSREDKAANPWGMWRVAGAELSADEKSLSNLKVIVNTTPSRMAFDDDGKLLITTQRKSPMGASNLKDTFGKVLRINKDGSVPSDNPFIGNDDVNDMAYVIGLRNANSMAKNPTTGDFWVADQGGTTGDEINVLDAGKDYGWPYVSYSPMPRERAEGESGVMKEGTGGMFPQWKGNLFLTGLSSMHLSRLVLVGDNVAGEERLLDEPGHRLRHVSQDADGAIYVLQDTPMRKILKITAPE
jgi:glucose/arabinose dehydrogenase